MSRWLKRGFVAAFSLVVLETLYAILRPSPELEEFDPSGLFGDGSLQPLKVAVLGDSSVTAPGVSGPEDIWIHRLCSRLGERYRVELKSFAVAGSKASDLLESQLGPAMAFEPDLAFLAVGANDAIKGVTVADFESDLARLVTELSDTGATVVLPGVGDLGTIPRLYPPLRNLMTMRSDRFNEVHRRLAAKHGALFIDQRSDDRKLWLDDKTLWADDLFHVSASGHRRWADLAWKAIEPTLPALRP